LVLTKEKHFPGWWALLPVIGASLILAAGAQAWFNRVFLSAPVVVWFGIISFPLYLWHWPLLSFARIMAGDTPPAAVRYGVIVASVLLAWATHKLVEHPLRFGARRKRNTTILLAGMTLTGVAGYGVHLADGLPARLNEFQRRQTHETLTQMRAATSSVLLGGMQGRSRLAISFCHPGSGCTERGSRSSGIPTRTGCTSA
jgi:hypothetical protein